MAWTLTLLYLLFSFSSVAIAQTSNAVCLPYYSWISNTQGKTPCEVASSLLATCTDDNKFDVVALPLGRHYQGPTRVANANPCMCNTVVFSLMSACGLCQGRNDIRWSEWSANCPLITLGNFPNPLPDGIRVPAWAYQDVKTSDVFDQFLARDSVNATESTATPIPASTSAQTIATTSEAITTPVESSSTGADSPFSEPDAAQAEERARFNYANKLAGSIVGSLLGAGLIIMVAIVVLNRRRNTNNSPGTGMRSQLESQPESMKEQSPFDSVPSIRVSMSASSRGNH